MKRYQMIGKEDTYAMVEGINPESYSLLSVVSKEKYFEFDMADNNYNLNLYKEVMRMMNQVDGTQEKKWDRSR